MAAPFSRTSRNLYGSSANDGALDGAPESQDVLEHGKGPGGAAHDTVHIEIDATRNTMASILISSDENNTGGGVKEEEEEEAEADFRTYEIIESGRNPAKGIAKGKVLQVDGVWLPKQKAGVHKKAILIADKKASKQALIKELMAAPSEVMFQESGSRYFRGNEVRCPNCGL